MALTQEQIKNVLGTSKQRNTILTAEMKEAIAGMIETESTLDDITQSLQVDFEGGDKVKKEHVRNYLRRQLKKSQSNA